MIKWVMLTNVLRTIVNKKILKKVGTTFIGKYKRSSKKLIFLPIKIL